LDCHVQTSTMQAVVRLYIQHEAPLNLAFQLQLVLFSSQAARECLLL
jgi:hypothetical protein